MSSVLFITLGIIIGLLLVFLVIIVCIHIIKTDGLSPSVFSVRKQKKHEFSEYPQAKVITTEEPLSDVIEKILE